MLLAFVDTAPRYQRLISRNASAWLTEMTPNISQKHFIRVE